MFIKLIVNATQLIVELNKLDQHAGHCLMDQCPIDRRLCDSHRELRELRFSLWNSHYGIHSMDSQNEPTTHQNLMIKCASIGVCIHRSTMSTSNEFDVLISQDDQLAQSSGKVNPQKVHTRK